MKGLVKGLKVVLIVKIAVTLVFWSLPFLVLPETSFKWLGMPVLTPIVFIRLLGAAYLALMVGYVLGFLDLCNGKEIPNVVIVGVVSNGLASLITFYFGFTGALYDWGGLAQFFMWFSAVMAGLITLGLAFFGLRLYAVKVSV